MREIKFRAWDIEKSKMISNIQETWDCGQCAEEYGMGDPNIVESFDEYLKNERYIVMQFTGLKDKNGKEGYHGDIWEINKVKYEVEWNEKRAGFELVMRSGERKTIHVLSMAHFPEGEVVGNIYENPELLEA